MDAADIAGLNDFNDEIITRVRTSLCKGPLVNRGTCLYCESTIANNLIYCDSDCMTDHKNQEKIRQRQTQRSI